MVEERSLDDFILPKKPNHRRRALIVAGVLVALFAAALLGLRGGLDVTLVKQQLDQFAMQLREEGKKKGRHIELTYGDIEMAGGFANRMAIVREPRLLLKPEIAPPGEPGKPNSLLITSPVLEIHAASSAFSALTIALPLPVDVASEEEPTRSMLKISANAPLALEVVQKKIDDIPFMQWRQSLPKEIRLTYLHEEQAAGTEDTTPTVVPVYQTLILTADKAEGRFMRAQDESGLGEAQLALDNVQIIPEVEPEGAIKIGKLRGNWSNKLEDDDTTSMAGTMVIDAITAAPEIIPYAPISFAFDASQHGTMPEPGKPTDRAGSYQLKTFRLNTKDASVDASADFATAAGELLPVGKANLKVNNLPFVVNELMHLGFLGKENDALIAAIVESVSAQPYAEVKNLDVAINRPQGGAFTVGKATFEELFTLVLSHKLQQLTGGQANIIVAPEKPKAPQVMEANPYDSQG